tara:strand:+ start:4076 stop:4525 length:450 start_codon:yes stop_codon:yes gene_type:complete
VTSNRFQPLSDDVQIKEEDIGPLSILKRPSETGSQRWAVKPIVVYNAHSAPATRPVLSPLAQAYSSKVPNFLKLNDDEYKTYCASRRDLIYRLDANQANRDIMEGTLDTHLFQSMFKESDYLTAIEAYEMEERSRYLSQSHPMNGSECK